MTELAKARDLAKKLGYVSSDGSQHLAPGTDIYVSHATPPERLAAYVAAGLNLIYSLDRRLRS